jgi:hypothetical protein
MNMLYNFITKKADLLHSKLFSKDHQYNTNFIIVKSILEEIVSRGINFYDSATVDVVNNMYEHDQYTIPGGLCSIFTTLNNINSVKIMKYVDIPNINDFSYVSSSAEDEIEFYYEEDNLNI